MTREARIEQDGLAAVAEWEGVHGELTEREMAEARQRVADEPHQAPPRST